MNFRFAFILSLIFACLCSCSNNEDKGDSVTKNKKPGVSHETFLSNAELFNEAMDNLTDVIVHDIFSPPVASRIYTYPSIAAYEVLSQTNDQYHSLNGQLTGLSPIPEPKDDAAINPHLAALQAFHEVSKTLVFSDAKIDTFYHNFIKEVKNTDISDSRMKASVDYGHLVAQHIINWASKDNYKETRTDPKYTILYEEDKWQPTPPDYMEGIEPHWNKIRPFVIDSASQFQPVLPTTFDMNKSSQFYKELVEVYDVGVNLSEEQEAIAQFWDCNPYVSHHHGHVMYATKKITPGGHWIGITKIACQQTKADFIETVRAYTSVSITLADAFISCWDEKWRSILVRPETLINKYIDEKWEPLLQTPPFPEYTSGHSVVSGSASIMLSKIFGEDFHFIDSTEVKYGLPPRTFDSFKLAADEAAVSRLYGGIHYRPAIANGITQGRSLGTYLSNELKTKKEASTALTNNP